MNNRFIIFMFLLIPIHLFSQQLELIDEIKGRYSGIINIQVNSEHQKYYEFTGASDSVLINENKINLLPRDTIIDSPYRYGRSYLFGVAEEYSKIFTKQHSIDHLVLTDSSILAFVTFKDDTLFTPDTFFVNSGDERNLVILNYSLTGELLHCRQVKSNHPTQFYIQGSAYIDGKLFVTGKFSSALFDLDSLELYSHGTTNTFVAEVGTDLTITSLWGTSVENNGITAKLTSSSRSDLLHVVSCTQSNYAFSQGCDTLYNSSLSATGTSFPGLFRFDTIGNCLASTTIDYDVQGAVINALSSIGKESFVAIGTHSARYLGFDSLYIYNPKGQRLGFLVKLSKDLSAQRLMQLNASNVGSSIVDVISTDQQEIYVSGWFTADTMRIGDVLLQKNPDKSKSSYYAKLDSNLNVLFADTISDESAVRVIYGADKKVYLLANNGYGRSNLYMIKDSLSATNSIDNVHLNGIRLFPNPISRGELLQLDVSQLLDQGHQLRSMNVFSSTGKEVLSAAVSDELPDHFDTSSWPKGMLFVQFNLENGQRIVKKMIVY